MRKHNDDFRSIMAYRAKFDFDGQIIPDKSGDWKSCIIGRMKKLKEEYWIMDFFSSLHKSPQVTLFLPSFLD